MSKKIICSLASGSRGNCVFLKTKTASFLIDAGLGYKELEKRLSEINESIKNIDAILITHEHKDHIDGLKTILQKKDILVFSNLETAKKIYEHHQVLFKFKIFTTDEEFFFKDIKILPFSIPHDAIEPVGFIFHIEDKKIGFCTDAGFVTSLMRKKLENSHILYIEANHEENMVLASPRPKYLKKRILGRQGHLSNEECKNLIKSILHENLEHVFLSHLSKECNNEELCFKKIKQVLEKTNLYLTFQDKISEKILF